MTREREELNTALARLVTTPGPDTWGRLVGSWAIVISAIEDGYRLGMDDYVNDLDCRQTLEDAMDAIHLPADSPLRSEVTALDGRFIVATREVPDALWGERKPNRSKYWWSYRLPAQYGQRMQETLGGYSQQLALSTEEANEAKNPSSTQDVRLSPATPSSVLRVQQTRIWEDLIAQWAEVVTEIEAGYERTFDNYVNALVTRLSIERALDAGYPAPSSSTHQQLVSLDRRFKRATKPVLHPLGGYEHVEPDRRKSWWYFRLPLRYGDEMASDLEWWPRQGNHGTLVKGTEE